MANGQRFPHVEGFEIEELVGHGGFAVVYRAIQPSLGRSVALKVLRPTAATDHETMSRFEKECRAIGSLTSHPSVVTVLEIGATADGEPYLALEYLPGGSMQARLDALGPRPWEEVVAVGIAITDALEAAHDLGILHRDVKPANIMCDAFGRFRLGDFGIASLASSASTTLGSTATTVAYAAPEVLLGERATPRSDVYGVGATLYALLTGHPAFSRDTDESVVPMIMRITSQPLEPLPAGVAPDALVGLVAALMAKDPADRPASASEVSDHLQRMTPDNPPAASAPVSLPHPTALGAHAWGQATPRPPTPAPPARRPLPAAEYTAVLRRAPGSEYRVGAYHELVESGIDPEVAAWFAENAGPTILGAGSSTRDPGPSATDPTTFVSSPVHQTTNVASSPSAPAEPRVTSDDPTWPDPPAPTMDGRSGTDDPSEMTVVRPRPSAP